MSKGRTKTRLLLAAIALCAVALSCVRDSDAGGKIRNSLPLQELRDGDLLFRCGIGTESQTVKAIDKNKGVVYTHVGIAIKQGGVWKVVHAVPGESDGGVDRVKIEPVDTFFLTTRAVHGAAMRVACSDTRSAHEAALWALNKKGVPFDDRYNWNDRSRLYCTELVHAAYESVGVDLAGGMMSNISLPFFKGNIVFPSDVARRDSLDVIFSF